ncbi:MAG: transposase [Bacteroidetes bacterium]|nr:transposase [Bacteroidota bacterium]
MTLYKNKYRSESHRLPGWDYSSEGWYFLTWVVQDREHLFGEICDDEMVLNQYGLIVKKEILRTVEIRTGFILDEWIIMPNHVHILAGIINDNENNAFHGSQNDSGENHFIDETYGTVETHGNDETHVIDETHGIVDTHSCAYLRNNHAFQNIRTFNIGKINKQKPEFVRLPRSISSFVAGTKSTITTQINQLRNTPYQRVWLRNYNDHIVRDENEFYRIRNYIRNNTKNWNRDNLYDKDK